LFAVNVIVIPVPMGKGLSLGVREIWASSATVEPQVPPCWHVPPDGHAAPTAMHCPLTEQPAQVPLPLVAHCPLDWQVPLVGQAAPTAMHCPLTEQPAQVPLPLATHWLFWFFVVPGWQR
jgi:hypothetical protein